jgi:AcrR family transcriptional regulator
MTKGAETRREIVAEALSLAGKVGLEGVSLGTLADRLDLSKSGLFAHFRSKEALQLEVVQVAIDSFVKQVVLPALTKPRGEPRLRALFDRYLTWIRGSPSSGGCFFMALTQEYDDRPGPVRDLLVQSQRDWYATVARATRLAIEEQHLAPEADAQQIAYEAIGIGMAFQQAHRLLSDPNAERYARKAFESLLERHRATPATR